MATFRYDFMHGNEEFTDRSELFGLAVCTYLFEEMERQYTEPEEEDDEPEQLALPFSGMASRNR